jgi:hypothetical protein
VEKENERISQWGKSEIERILTQTKAMEEQLIQGAKERQRQLDVSHTGELEKIVRELDLRKAAELKELEDGLQRQIQATLSTSKAEINRIESQMNQRKMDLLKQSQLKSAAEIDALSNLVVETKLVPSQTRTVIETNTSTGNVIAVATGAQIATGAAQADSYSSQKIAAVPNAGELTQQSDLTRGDMIEDRSGRKVGSGRITNTMTGVTEQKSQAQTQGGNQDVVVPARPLTNLSSTTGPGSAQQPIPLAGRSTATIATTSNIGGTAGAPGSTGIPALDRDVHSGATQRPGQPLPVDAGRAAGSTAGPVSAPLHDGQKAAYSDTTDSSRTKVDSVRPASNVHAAYGKHHPDQYAKHATSTSGTDAPHSEGILDKVKHALGMEPTSTDASSRKV